MNGTIAKSITFGAAALLAGLLLAAPALADGMPSKGKAAPAPEATDGRCAFSGYVGYTTDNVYRGFTKSAEQDAVRGSVDLTCGRFYGGVVGSSINFLGVASSEFDIYGGFRHQTGPVTWDLGFVYYAFPDTLGGIDIDYVELKAGASGEVWKGGTLGVMVYYSPDYFAQLGDAWTVEAGFKQALPTFHIFSPSVSALVGHTSLDDADYTYWNAGLTLGFHEKWAVDLRYWDTDVDFCDAGPVDFCGSRFVGSLKYTF